MSDFLSGENLHNEINNPLLGQDAIVEGLIFKDTANIIYGDPSCGKSVIAVNMLASMSGGWPVFGLLQMKQFSRCSYLQLEGSRSEMLGRLKEVSNKIPIDYENIAWHTTPVFVESNESQHIAMKQLLAYKPDVIFVDSLYCMTNRGLSKEEGFLPVRQMLKQIRDKTQATLIILHHTQKQQYHDGKKIEKDDPFLGSQYLKAFADMMIYCRRVSENRTILQVTKKSRNNEGIDKIVLSFDKLSWTVNAVTEDSSVPAITLVTNYLLKMFKDNKTITVDDIMKGTSLTRRHIRRLKKDRCFDHLADFKNIKGSETLWIPKIGKKIDNNFGG